MGICAISTEAEIQQQHGGADKGPGYPVFMAEDGGLIGRVEIGDVVFHNVLLILLPLVRAAKQSLSIKVASAELIRCCSSPGNR